MIFLILSGGLGNQMFQYAAARALALRTGKTMIMNTSFFLLNTRNTTPRLYELDLFQLPNDIPLKSSYLQSFFLHFLYPRIKNTMFGKCFLQNPDTLFGYFQSETYFKDAEEQIRNDFRFKLPLIGGNERIAEEMKQSTSVSIHVRRGDYITNKYAKEHFLPCPINYYRQAINYLLEKTDNPQFYVFSDEPDWAREHLPLPNATFVDWNKGKDSWVDMQLMSLCQHNIIANSSFSWWGAWLNPHPEKIVIAPAEWLKDKKANANISDLIPKKWIRL